MPGQINYYNQFGDLYKQSILDCPEPEYWTTDYHVRGRVYREMKERIDLQQQLVDEYFNKDLPVLDIGCGFGRQAVLLAKKGFSITGIDTSDVFIDIAQQLFSKHNYKGEFICLNIIENELPGRFPQILLLDVLEHVAPHQRRKLFEKLHTMSDSGSLLILSLPHVKKRVTSQLNNRLRRRITQYSTYFLNREEHPYPIPEKSTMLKLSEGLFSLHKFIESEQTDYYVFRRD
jgi:cyclopropane fatty-acyl-phospholipid synthase-like methyltransferase